MARTLFACSMTQRTADEMNKNPILVEGLIIKDFKLRVSSSTMLDFVGKLLTFISVLVTIHMTGCSEAKWK